MPKYIHGSQRKDKYQIVGDTKSQELSVKIVTRVIHRIFFYILVQKGKYQSIVNSTRTKSNFKIPLPFHNRFYNCSEIFQIILLSNQYSHKCDIHSHWDVFLTFYTQNIDPSWPISISYDEYRMVHFRTTIKRSFVLGESTLNIKSKNQLKAGNTGLFIYW